MELRHVADSVNLELLKLLCATRELLARGPSASFVARSYDPRR